MLRRISGRQEWGRLLSSKSWPSQPLPYWRSTLASDVHISHDLTCCNHFLTCLVAWEPAGRDGSARRTGRELTMNWSRRCTGQTPARNREWGRDGIRSVYFLEWVAEEFGSYDRVVPLVATERKDQGVKLKLWGAGELRLLSCTLLLLSVCSQGYSHLWGA